MAPTYEPIATQTLGSDTATITFSDIPGSYSDLVLSVAVRTASGGNEDNMLVRFNSDTGTNYSITWLYGNGSAASSGRLSNQTYVTTSAIPGGTSAAGTFSAATFQIMGYSNTNTFKTTLYSGGSIVASVIRVVGLWRSTSAITSMSISANSGTDYKSGSTFSLYGIREA